MLVIVAAGIVVLLNFIGVIKKLGSIQPSLVDNELIFKIKYGTTNGLLRLIIRDAETNSIVWDINLNYFYEEKLAYGEIPKEFETDNGVINNAKQNIPADGKPVDLVEGKVYEIYSDWQYDAFISAFVGSREEYFKIEKNNIVFVERTNN